MHILSNHTSNNKTPVVEIVTASQCWPNQAHPDSTEARQPQGSPQAGAQGSSILSPGYHHPLAGDRRRPCLSPSPLPCSEAGGAGAGLHSSCPDNLHQRAAAALLPHLQCLWWKSHTSSCFKDYMQQLQITSWKSQSSLQIKWEVITTD